MNTYSPAFQPILKRCLRLALAVLLLTSVLFVPGATRPAQAGTQTDIPGPAGSGQFGSLVQVLPNGNILVTDPGYDAPGPIPDAGAVYLYNGATRALISTLTGSTTGDLDGSFVTVLTNGNYLVASQAWDNGPAANVGAVTWGSSTTGVSGVISPANSLVGSVEGDNVSGCAFIAGSVCIKTLANGNYLVLNPYWHNGPAANAGAVTWGNGTTGVSGVISAANSLVGSKEYDSVAEGGVMVLANGNYLVASPDWANGTAINAGAVTWGSSITGVSGVISPANSLVGSTEFDWVGKYCLDGSCMALSNGNYLVQSPGAVTWGNGATGVSGVISAANSLVGDGVGAVTALSNGNYVVVSSGWDNGPIADVGAVTWGSGATGVRGAVSAANSLVGTTAGDLDYGIVTALTNGNYVVGSPNWDNGAAADVGAITWMNGTAAANGVVSAANSLVGSQAGDLIYGNVIALTNGNYVVASPRWDNGSVADVGAVTWMNGTVGASGAVSAANSLIGSQAGDMVGMYAKPLANGNYVVASFYWDNGAAADVGAVTWINGALGASGVVSAANSLVGSQADDQVGSGYVRVLSNGSYVVQSPHWHNGTAANAGAVTWGSGTTGVSGVLSAANSLVGTLAGDSVGWWDPRWGWCDDCVMALSNGNYLVRSPLWHNSVVPEIGAVTWGSGTTGVSGVVSAANSLVGSSIYDAVGYGEGFESRVTVLSNGSYVVASSSWDNGTVVNSGAVTWGSGTMGVRGIISAANSLVGSTAEDRVGIGGVTALSNGNYVVASSWWHNGGAGGAGAVTLGTGMTSSPCFTHGPITHANSVLGTAAGGGSGLNFAYDPVNHRLVVGRPADNMVSLFMASECAYLSFVPVIKR